MPDVIEPARSGRAKCRGCREKIEKDAMRFGEEVPNPYADEDDATAVHWFHLRCAAERRPEKVAAALASHDGEVPDRAELVAIAEAGMANPELSRVVRAERAPSGRARCRGCRELIEKDALRVVMRPEEDVDPMAPNFSLHVKCAAEKLGDTGLLDKLRRVSEQLGKDDLAELERAL
ncbi:MAG: PARP-type zinc finger-containing protein [Planctomycetota bacterium]|jgi:poly [ADP-ribose] polymerase